MYNILISPDSFKGTLSASEYCEICESAINDAVKDLNLDKNSINIKSIPLADGGEGTLKSLNGTKRICKSITDCDFNKREAYYGILNDDTVLIEIASCAALPDSVSKNPEITTTFGIGELFNTAYDEGYRKFIFALGGSATNDMGCGFASASGVKFYDENGNLFLPTGINISKIEKIDLTEAKEKFDNCQITAICDVTNPLYGKNGAAYVFAPQKGADPDMVMRLDNALKHLSEIIKRDYSVDLSEIRGGGAAGGFGAGLFFFAGGTLKSGIETVMDLCNYDEYIKQSDLVITGEGKFDSQSLHGKVISGVVEKCRKYSVPVIIICGSTEDNIGNSPDILAVFDIQRKALPLSESLPRNAKDLYTTVYNLFKFKLS